jgi:Fe-S cluster biogenesis protein NfuA
MTRVHSVGARVEELLGALRSGSLDRAPGPGSTGLGSTGPGGSTAPQPRAAEAAEELVGLLVGLYGDGLAAITRVIEQEGEAGAAILAKMADDPQVEGLLLLHDLHPLDVDARIQRALDRVRPYLGSHAGGVEYLGVTDGVAQLRLAGSCNGCASSTVTVELAIRSAVEDAAPEVTRVAVEGMTAPPEPKLLQIGQRPDADGPAGPGDQGMSAAAPRPAGEQTSGGSWITLPSIGPPSSRPVSASAGGTAVLVCSVRGTLFAYLDACASCGSSLADGRLDREELTCPACGTRYNVRLAGKGIDDPAAHLDPLPLLADSAGVRVAMPETARP